MVSLALRGKEQGRGSDTRQPRLSSWRQGPALAFLGMLRGTRATRGTLSRATWSGRAGDGPPERPRAARQAGPQLTMCISVHTEYIKISNLLLKINLSPRSRIKLLTQWRKLSPLWPQRAPRKSHTHTWPLRQPLPPAVPGAPQLALPRESMVSGTVYPTSAGGPGHPPTCPALRAAGSPAEHGVVTPPPAPTNFT